jgi:hypothetical protein
MRCLVLLLSLLLPRALEGKKYKDLNISSCPRNKQISIKQVNPVLGKINVSLNGGKGCRIKISLKKAVNTQVIIITHHGYICQ